MPAIDNLSDEGDIPPTTEGQISFKKVVFSYPKSSELVINGLDLEVNPGTTLALIGYSGSGKSTTLQLIERFYDPQEGSLFLDGRDLRSLNIHVSDKAFVYRFQIPFLL